MDKQKIHTRSMGRRNTRKLESWKGLIAMEKICTSEMIKGLSENPEVKYESDDFIAFTECGILKLSSKKDGRSWGAEGNLRIIGYGKSKSDEWRLVRQSVDFMEAINSGKKIKPEGNEVFVSIRSYLKEFVLNVNLINGKWYIED